MGERRQDLRVIDNVLVARPPADDATEVTAFWDRDAGELFFPDGSVWVSPGGAVSGPPEAHASSHATAGSDPIAPGDIGAETPAGAQAKADAVATSSSTALSNHEADTTGVHGIADTSVLETTSGAQTKANTAQSNAQVYADGVAATAQAGAEATAASALSGHESDTTAVHGIANTSQLALIDGSRNFSHVEVVDATGDNNSVQITPSANKSASTSVGGALNVTNTGSTGAGIVVYTNRGADAAGRLVAITQDNAANPQQVLYLKQDGTGHAVVIDNQGTGSSNLGLSVTSTNPDDTTGGFTGSQTGRAVLKATHNGSASTGNAAGLTIQLNGTNPATQGIFIDTASGYTGKLLNLRVNGVEMLVAYSDGSVESARGVVQRVCNLRRSTSQSIPNTTDTQVQWNAEDSDTQGWHSTVSNTDRVTPDIAGLYLVTANISFDTSASGGRLAAVVKNGTRTFGEARAHGVFSYSGTNLSVSGLVELNGSTDYVTTKIYQDSGGAINLIGDNGTGPFVNTLSVLFLGPIGS